MLPPNTTTFAVRYTERRSRLTTFFRLLLAIPHAIVLWFYGLFAAIAVIVAWFAIVFTAHYPQGLYDFVAGYHRYYGRFTGYTYLLADPYPPFSGREDREYPAVLDIGPPSGGPCQTCRAAVRRVRPGPSLVPMGRWSERILCRCRAPGCWNTARIGPAPMSR